MYYDVFRSSAVATTPSLSEVPREERRPDDSHARILLIVQKEAARERYHHAIRLTGARVDTVASIEAFQGAVTHSAYNGIVIDIPTKIQAMNRHKDLVSSILDRFPVIQVNQEKESGRIRALLYGQHTRHGELEELIREACLSRPPRRFRATRRHPIHFNLLLARSRRFEAGETERTVTLNVSPDGCFIFTTARYQQGQQVWIRIMELYDKTPMACGVIHKRKWGAEMAIPGIGVCFQSIKEAQARALAAQCPPPLKPERIVCHP